MLFKKTNLSAHRFPRKVTEAACTLYSPKWSVSTHLRPFLLPIQNGQSHKQLNWRERGRERTAAKAVSRRSSGLGTHAPALLAFRKHFQSVIRLWEREEGISGPMRGLIHLWQPCAFNIAKHSGALMVFKESSKCWV